MSESLKHQIPVTLEEVPQFDVDVIQHRTAQAIEEGTIDPYRLAEPASQQANMSQALKTYSNDGITAPKNVDTTPKKTFKEKAVATVAIGSMVVALGLAGKSDQDAERQVTKNNPANHIQR